jgi:acyl dehydratase
MERTVEVVRGLHGKAVGPSQWLHVPQTQIDAFGAAVGDPGSVHTDAAIAADTRYGTTIAHGFLTLQLVLSIWDEVSGLAGAPVVVYGVDRVRFPAPVPSGSRIRGRFRVLAVRELEVGARVTIHVELEGEEDAKPVCVAELVLLYLR